MADRNRYCSMPLLQQQPPSPYAKWLNIQVSHGRDWLSSELHASGRRLKWWVSCFARLRPLVERNEPILEAAACKTKKVAISILAMQPEKLRREKRQTESYDALDEESRLEGTRYR